MGSCPAIRQSFATLQMTTRGFRLLRVLPPGFGNQNNFQNNTILLRTKSTKSTTAEDELDEPIKFSTSGAAKWTAEQTHGSGQPKDIPWIQGISVSASMSIFLLYFLAFREENDVDERINKPLWEKVPGLEKQQLEIVLAYNEENGLPTEDIIKRLQEINAAPANKS